MILRSTLLSIFPEITHGWSGIPSNYLKDYQQSYEAESAPHLKITGRQLQEIGQSAHSLFLLKQVHGDTVITLRKKEERWPFTKRLQADAIITKLSDTAIGIYTADCGPVLFYAPKTRLIGAAHVGWRGAFKGIVSRTIQAMEAEGAARKDIRAVLGPTIQTHDYEVKADFITFCKNQSLPCNHFLFQDAGKHFFNLPAFIISQIKKMRLENIEDLKINTFSQPFFSHRRWQKNRTLGGSNIAFIVRRKETV